MREVYFLPVSVAILVKDLLLLPFPPLPGNSFIHRQILISTYYVPGTGFVQAEKEESSLQGTQSAWNGNQITVR